jgi:hypothetical protein
MANAAVVITNLADAGAWTASTEEALMPVSRLQGEHVSERWRSTDEPATVTCDLGADRPLDTVALLGLTVGATATIAVKISTEAGGASSGNVLDQTYDAGDAELDPDYGMIVVLLDVPADARYVRFVVTDGPASYVEAGRGVIGLREAFDFNFAPGAAVQSNDRARRSKTAGGQTLIFADNRFRSVELNFEWVSAGQREGLFESLGRVNGASRDVLLMLDTASGNLCRDTVWGLVTSPARILYTPVADIFSAPLTIEERL